MIDGVRKKIKILYWKIKYRDRIDIPWNLSFRRDFIINISKNGLLKIGDNCFFNNYCAINCMKEIVIGNNNIFGENVKIYDHNHVFNKEKFDLNELKTEKIEIGNENWIASNVVILKKTKMKNRNVVGAGIILNQELDSYNLLKCKQDIEITAINVEVTK